MRRERDFVASVLDTSEAFVIMLDPQGWIMMFNRKCQEVSGYDEYEVLGRVIWDFLIPAEDVDRVRLALQVTSDRRPPRYFENPWLTKHGQRVPVLWSNSVVWNQVGEPVYLILTGLDASERVEREERSSSGTRN